MTNIQLFVLFNAVAAIALMVIVELPAITIIIVGSNLTTQEFYISTFIIVFIMSLMYTVLAK